MSKTGDKRHSTRLTYEPHETPEVLELFTTTTRPTTTLCTNGTRHKCCDSCRNLNGVVVLSDSSFSLAIVVVELIAVSVAVDMVTLHHHHHHHHQQQQQHTLTTTRLAGIYTTTL